jgi:hypothetical protein
MLTITVLFVAMLLCLIYLTVDWLVDEVKRARANKQELETWDALTNNPNETNERTKTNK